MRRSNRGWLRGRAVRLLPGHVVRRRREPLSWNPATANFAGAGLTFESSYSVILMSADLTVTNPGAQLVTGPADTEMGRNALIGASYATWRLDNKMVLALSLTSPFGLGTKAENQNWVGSLEGVTECRAQAEDYLLYSTRVPRTIVALVKHLEDQNNELVSLEISAPSLEDIFLELTGRRLRD